MFSKRIFKRAENQRRVIFYILSRRIARIIPDKIFLEIKYKAAIGKKLNLDDPRSFTEKIQWLKLYDRQPEYTQFADKYAVRQHIKDTLGEEYLIPLLGVYDSYDEIDFETLPNQFVLKPNHTSGNIYICKDKTKIDYPGLKKLVEKWMKREYYWMHREWQYKNIKPRLICEKYMVDESGDDLKDYKFMCFHGEIKYSLVCSNRNAQNGLKIEHFDPNWKLMPFTFETHFDPNCEEITSKPKEYEKMCAFAEKLSKDMPFVRVDFYETNGHLYFGELTFHPGSGFGVIAPESYDYLLGSWINLPINKNS